MKKIVAFTCVLWFIVFLMPVVLLRGQGVDVGTIQDDDTPYADALPASVMVSQKSDGADDGDGSPSADGVRTTDAGVELTVLIEGEVRTLTLDVYLAGVLAAEMPASFPDDALRAQAVAARSYVMQKKRAYESGGSVPESHKGAMLCDNPAHCSAYIDLESEAARLFGSNAALYTERLHAAVRDTDGLIAVYDDAPILAAFHAISGGKTERAADVWGTDVPYLQSVDSPGEEVAARYYGEVTMSADEFAQDFSEKYPSADFSAPASGWFRDSTRSEAGGILQVHVGGVVVSGRDMRALLGLQSTDFTVAVTEDENGKEQLTFRTTGYGHGVGMSQYGARQMALDGASWKDIIARYYTGVDIVSLADAA